MRFKVIRQNSILIPPSEPTPYDFKLLSDVDDQESFQTHALGIHIYKKKPSMEGKDPAKVIHDAIANALVFYYPFAGRVREVDNGKLGVECTGEGVLFIEADADVALEEFGHQLYPPFSCLVELLYYDYVPGSARILNYPLLLFQVTRLKCGGFILAWCFNHTICDAIGFNQFLFDMGKIARGATTLSIPHVWNRHLLTSQYPHHVSCTHRKNDIIPHTKETLASLGDIVNCSFFFGDAEISALRHQLPSHYESCSKFELITACLWRCRTIALFTDPKKLTRLICPVNARNQFRPPLTTGYYGNACAFPVVTSNVKALCNTPFHHVVDLVMMMKSIVTEDYLKSSDSLVVLKDGQPITEVQSFLVTDVSNFRSENIDFGWGKAMYGGSVGDVGPFSFVMCYIVSFKNNKGEKGKIVLIRLPAKNMDVFVREMETMLIKKYDHSVSQRSKVCTSSKL